MPRRWSVLVAVLAAAVVIGLVMLNQRDAGRVSRADLAASLAQRLDSTFGEYSPVTCEGGLARSTGASQTCTATVRRTTYRVTITMTDDRGANTLSISPTPPAFAAAKLERAVSTDYERENGVKPTSAHCPGSLSTTAGDHLTCELTVRGTVVEGTVTVGETDATTGITPFTAAFTPGG